MSRRRTAGLVAIGLGVAGAAVGGAVAAQRRAIGQARSRPDPYVDEPLGQLHSRGVEVVADDGVPLHVEVEGDEQAPLTIVFAHGYTLSIDCWHFQRRDLRDIGRLVFYDQRSHGASGRSSHEHATIDQLGRDLYAVLQAVAPTGPVVLVGHSMGGMTILALADQHPELFGDRVIGVALLSTTTGKLAETLFGLPGWTLRLARPLMPGAVRAMQRRSALLERGRRTGTDAGFLTTRWVSFQKDVPPSLVEFMERMVSKTSMEVMTDFFDTFLSHDKLKALEVLRDVPVLISCGEGDVLTPLSHSELMADALPEAELQIMSDGAHMAILDKHDEVNAALRRLVERAVVPHESRASA